MNFHKLISASKAGLKRSWLSVNAQIWDRWHLDQQIALQGLNRTVFDYDIDYFGSHEAYVPDLRDDDPVALVPEFALHYTPQYLSRPYSYKISRAVVHRNLIIDPENTNRQILEMYPVVAYVTEGSNFPINSDRIAKCRRAAKQASGADVDEGYLFSGYWWSNYFHFVVDYLTRYIGLEEAGRVSANTTLLISNTPNRWQKTYFDVLGLSEDRFRLTKDKPLIVEQAILASPRRHRFACSPAAIDGLRNRVFRSLKIEGEYRKLVYISRSKAGTRRVLNEDDLVSLLKSYGFEVHHLEELSVGQQIKLFADCKCVVAPHGAGLANLVYSERPLVIELFPRVAWEKGFYIALANSIGGQHIPIVSNEDSNDDDFAVNLPEVEDALKRHGLGRVTCA